jgi:hypothetical protein
MYQSAFRARAVRAFAALAFYCLAAAFAPVASAQQLSIADVSVAEGNAGSKLMTFTIKMSAASGTLVRVDVATANGNATAGSDYVATATAGLRIPAGSTSKTFTVSILGDTIPEADEVFSVNLSNAVGATISDASAIGTILNDDVAPTPTISIYDAFVTEGDLGTQYMNFQVALSAPSATDVSFTFGTADGSAVAGTDYVATGPFTQTITAGGNLVMFMVPVNGDTEIEANENFFANLSNVSGATLLDGQAVGTIYNDDQPPSLRVEDISIEEGDGGSKLATFTVSLSRTWGSDVSFDVATSDDTATAGSDYIALALAHQVIPAGQTSKDFTVTINGDTAVEPIEYFKFTLGNVSGADVQDGDAVAAILNDDLPSLSVGDVVITEGDSGSKLANFTVSLSAPAPAQVPYQIGTSDLSAQSGSDYASNGGSYAFQQGESSQVFSVEIDGDTVYEPDETFAVTIVDAYGATIADGEAIGTISNDDAPPPELTIANVSVSEGNSGTKLATFTVSLSKPALVPVSFNIGTTWHPGQTAEAGSDYDSHFSFLSIPVGGTSATFDVTIKGDTDFESDEFFQVDVDNVIGATVVDGIADGTIVNDDPRPTPNMAIGDV